MTLRGLALATKCLKAWCAQNPPWHPAYERVVRKQEQLTKRFHYECWRFYSGG